MWIKYHQISVGKQEQVCLQTQTVASPQKHSKTFKKWDSSVAATNPNLLSKFNAKELISKSAKRLTLGMGCLDVYKKRYQSCHMCVSTCFAIVALETSSKAERWAATILQIWQEIRIVCKIQTLAFFSELLNLKFSIQNQKSELELWILGFTTQASCTDIFATKGKASEREL